MRINKNQGVEYSSPRKSISHPLAVEDCMKIDRSLGRILLQLMC